MSIETQEIIRICETLPEGKREKAAEFARFLLDRQDDDVWERIIADPRARPKLDAFVRAALADGNESLDLDRL